MNPLTLVAVLALTFSSTSIDPSLPLQQRTAASMCFGRVATIVGTVASETILGTAGPDVIVGGGGNDTIEGRGGNDRICDASGPGNVNTLRGGPGDDHLSGAATLMGNGGDDVLVVAGTVGSTVFLAGGPGDDHLKAPILKSCLRARTRTGHGRRQRRS